MANQNLNKLEDNRKLVDASPSKSFFVEMLTRDIELKDAVLDLLDNCLDGVLRTLDAQEKNNEGNRNGNGAAPPDGDSPAPYSGFKAHIEYGEKFFRISDNCGGMSKEILEKHAFRLGRPALERDKDLATVGLYGIGMKRAIFKMGTSCTVTSRHGNEAYRVVITPEWMKDDDDWRLPIEKINHEDLEEGTLIEINSLRNEVATEFDIEKNKAFDEEFRRLVSTHYSYIIQKGFEVAVNKKPVKGQEIRLRFAEDISGKNKLAPYMYRGVIDKVEVDLVVGLYRNVPSATELEEMDKGGGNRKENAGWTVICNDRVVLYNDTTFLTGWGEGQVPKYHTQFIAISGVVRFYSSNPKKLPVTTTKRGISLNSELYSNVKNIMREGLKHFTDFTNKWKSNSEERRQIYSQTIAVEPLKAFDLVKPKEWTNAKKIPGRLFIPKLPTPKEEGDAIKTIKFSRPLSEISKVAEYLLSDSNAAPSRVGEKCFDDYYALAKSELTV